MLVSLVVWWITLVECGLFPEATVGFSLVDRRVIVTMVTFRREQMYRRDDKTGVGSFVPEFGVLMGRKRVDEAMSATGVEETFFTGVFLKDRDKQSIQNQLNVWFWFRTENWNYLQKPLRSCHRSLSTAFMSSSYLYRRLGVKGLLSIQYSV